MKRSNANYWLYQLKNKKTGKPIPHSKWKFRYLGVNGKYKHGTGFKDKQETARLALQLAMEADEIRRGIRKEPEIADTESLRAIMEHVEAYLKWGRTQGGRGGRPWSKTHLRKLEPKLLWWVKKLKLKTLRDIKLPPVEKVLQERASEGCSGKGCSGKTLTHDATVLKAFVNWCIKPGHEFLSNDPLEGLTKFNSKPQTRRRAMTPEEIGKLLSAVGLDRRLVYETVICTGFRAGEIRSLRVGHLDKKRAMLNLDADFAKDRIDAPYPIPRSLADALAKACEGRADDERLLTGLNRNQDRNFNKDIKKAGIEKQNFHGILVFHALRNTSIDLGIDLGFDVKTAQTLARHKDPIP